MKKIYLFVFLVVLAFSSYSQQWKLGRFEIIGGVGTSNYFGDLGGAKIRDKMGIADLDIEYTRPSLVFGARYRIKEKMAIKAIIGYANIYGSDISSFNNYRAYSFSTNLFELSGQFEYDFFSPKRYSRFSTRGVRDALYKFKASITAYGFVGLGGAVFFQKAKDDLITSGRFVDNKHLALAIPLGVGVKYPLTNRMFVGFEFGGRFTTSDYIDGFSPIASNSIDIYYLSVVNVSYKIKKRGYKRRGINF